MAKGGRTSLDLALLFSFNMFQFPKLQQQKDPKRALLIFAFLPLCTAFARMAGRLAILSRHLSTASTAGPAGSGEVALIVGAGPGVSASCARLFARDGMKVALAARDPDKESLRGLPATRYACDCSSAESVARLFEAVKGDLGSAPNLVVYNASAGARGPIETLDPEAVRQALMVCAYGGFAVAQQAAKGMLEEQRQQQNDGSNGSSSGHRPRPQSILFTGASASYKGYPRSCSFAMGKFGLAGLAQSLARELGPKGIHVAQFPIDGGIGKLDSNGAKTAHWGRYRASTARVAAGDSDECSAGTGREERRRGTNGDPIDDSDTMLHPDAIAEAYLFVHRQHRSAWTFEVQLRPWAENW